MLSSPSSLQVLKNMLHVSSKRTWFVTVALFLAFTPIRHALSIKAPITQAPPYCINFKCTVKPSRRDEFLSLIKENQHLTLETEPHALQYIVGEDITTPNTFYIHEQFTSHEGFLAHKKTSHNANWQDFRSTHPFVQDPIIKLYHGTHIATKVPVRDAYCVHVELCISPQVREAFQQVIADNARGSNENEPLCLQYVWGQDVNAENVYHFHEEYLGQEGFEAHAATRHFQAWETFAATNPFTKPPVVDFYTTI